MSATDSPSSLDAEAAARPLVDGDAGEATEAARPPTLLARGTAPGAAVLDETDILAALGAGDRRGALTLLMQRYGQPLYRYCRELVRDDALADDVHQQVFIEAYRDLAGFQGRSSLKTWLYGIARHRSLDALKGSRRWTGRFKHDAGGDEDADAAPTVDERLDDERLRVALARCLHTLAPAARIAVLLRFQEGFSYEDMARICGERAGTLQQRVTRALPVLRTCIETRSGGRL